MGQLGFTTYIMPEPQAQPTLAERFAALTGQEKVAILDGFSSEIIPNVLKHMITIEKDLIIGVYREIDAIEEECRSLMREEVILEEEVVDPETGEVITPAEYNIAPASINELKDQVSAEFDEIFSEAEVGAVVDRIILHSAKDANGDLVGTAVIYAAEVIK